MYRIIMFQNRDTLMSEDRDANHAAKLSHDDSPTSTGEKIAAGVIAAGIYLGVLWAGDAFGRIVTG